MKNFSDLLSNRVFEDDVDLDTASEEQKRRAKIYNQIDLEEACAQALQQGMEQGLTQARQEIAQHMANSLDVLNQALQQILEQQEAAQILAQQQAAGLVLTTIEKLFPHLMADRPLEDVKLLVEEALKTQFDTPSLTLILHPDLLQEAEQQIPQLPALQGFKGEFRLQDNPKLAPGDCRVEWEGGGFERQPEQLLSQIRDIFLKSEAQLPADAPPPSPEAAPEPNADHSNVDGEGLAQTATESDNRDNTEEEDAVTHD